MKDNKKKIEEQERLLDHLIEYGGRQLIDEEIQKFEDLPEMEIPKDLDDRMDESILARRLPPALLLS